MKIYKTLTVIFLTFLIYGCGPSLEDAQKLGFKDVKEMKDLKKLGFANAEDYAKSLGFKNLEEMRVAEPSKTAEEYATKLGYLNLAEMRDLQGKGFKDILAYAESKEFKDIESFRSAQKVGIDNKSEYDKYLAKKKIEEELAAKRAQDPYFDFPQDERGFIKAVSSGQNSSRNVSNDMQRGGVKNTRDKAICEIIGNSFEVNNWFGTVENITSNSDGFGVVSIKIASGILLKTWNNSFSDYSDHSMISPNDPIFQKVSMLNKGDEVKFSGFFYPSSGDCIKEGSISLSGKLLEPEFIFKFKKIVARTTTE